MQLHVGCSRNNNLRWLPTLGPDTGFDAIADPVGIQATARFLAALDATGQLPRTVLYNLNPADNEAMACLTGCFPGEGARGKIQYGSAWWFNDHRRGIENQLSALAEQSVLGNFIGMTTDSRSFLSYPRHEYFRRILCALLGRWIERGEAPRDFALVGGLVKDVSYANAARFFGL
jgi:glucuronate isomerase